MSSECSSIPDAKFFNEKYRYPSWFSRKKLIFHNKMLKRLRKLRFLHSRSSQYYDKANLRLSAPSIIITSISGIASFLSTSQYIDSDAQNAFGITVGVLASVSSIFQALSAACQYSVKREAHRTVAEQYNALIVKTKFEMEMPNEEDFIDNLEIAILDIQAKCNYFVPQFIIDEWMKHDQKESNKIDDSYTDKTTQSSNDVNISIFTDDYTDDDDNNDANNNDDSNGANNNDNNNNNNGNTNDDDAHDINNININIEPPINSLASENTYLLKKETNQNKEQSVIEQSVIEQPVLEQSVLEQSVLEQSVLEIRKTLAENSSKTSV